jgi:predicted DNA-binding protein with PD1-like motif
MKFKLLNDDGQKTFALVLDTGDEVTSCIADFAKKQGISAAQFTGIGACSGATLGFFDIAVKEYKKIVVTEQTEVLSLLGDLSLYKNEPKLHAHVVLGKKDGTAHGGHLLQAIARPTVEIILTESPAYLKRKMDDATGIPLISIDETTL